MDRSHQTGSTSTAPPARKPLSCVNCRQRKIKCDRTSPCVHCQKSNVECKFPARVRTVRPKHGASVSRDSELLQRIARLENLVKKIDPEKLQEIQDSTADEKATDGENADAIPVLAFSASFAETNEKIPASKLLDTYASTVSRQSNTNAILGGDFWTTLTDEVGGMRQLLEHDEYDDEEEEANSSGPGEYTDSHGSTPSFIFGSSPGGSTPEHHPSFAERKILLGVYMRNVHPMCKILHGPSAKFHLAAGEDMGFPDTGVFKFPAMEAVANAAGLLTVISMTPEECLADLGQDRDVLVRNYKNISELSLSRANVMDSMELLTIQALICYIIALRTIDRGRSSWTLIAIALRLAQGLGLNKNESLQVFTPYEVEMRRRIWWQILILDLRAADDRGSEPMIDDGSFNTLMPSNIIEEEFGPFIKSPFPVRVGYTDMTVTLMTCDTSNIARKLGRQSLNPARPLLSLQEKQDMIKACAQRIEGEYLLGCDAADPRMSLLFTMGRFLILKLWTLAQYPFQRRDPETRKFPRGQALRTVIAVLEIAEIFENDPNVQNYVWYFRSWVPWHPLAVALVELCSETRGELVTRAWGVIDKGYSKWSTRVSPTSWRPVRKLYQKALAVRHATQAEDMARAQSSFNQSVNHADVVPELPALSLDPVASGASFYTAPVNADPFGQNVPFPWDIEFMPNMTNTLPSFDEFDNGTWNTWNDFVFDVHAFDAAAEMTV